MGIQSRRPICSKKAFPQYAVPKDDFNAKLEDIKAKTAAIDTANKTIDELKKQNGDNAALQAKVTEYEGKVKELETAADETAKTYALKPYKEDKAMAHLFQNQGGYAPKLGGGAPAKNPFAKDTFNLASQVAPKVNIPFFEDLTGDSEQVIEGAATLWHRLPECKAAPSA